MQACSRLSQSYCWADKIYFNRTESTFASVAWTGSSVCVLHIGQQSPAEILAFYPDSSVSVVLNGGSRCLKTLEHITSPCAPTRCSFIWLLFPLLYLFPIYSRASLFALTRTHTHAHTHEWARASAHMHARTNTEDERRRVAPLPALRQVAQTNWQQQNGPEKAFFFSPRDLSAVLTSNFIFIDTAYFLPSAVWQPGGWVCGWGGIWYPSMHHQSGQYASVTEEQIHAFLTPSSFLEIHFLLWKICICAASWLSLCEVMQFQWLWNVLLCLLRILCRSNQAEIVHCSSRSSWSRASWVTAQQLNLLHLMYLLSYRTAGRHLQQSVAWTSSAEYMMRRCYTTC